MKKHAKIKKNFEICKKMRNFAAFLINIHMKRIILLAFTAFSMSLMAQHVTPLSIPFSEVRIDSLRTLYISEPTMYRASLEVAAQQLSKTSEAIKAAKAELKTEQAHGKEMTKSLKEASKMVASLKKLYSKEEGEIKSMQKVVEKQLKTLNKQKELNQESKDTYTKFLEKQQKELAYCLRDIADRQKSVADLEGAIQTRQNGLQTYIRETELKANDLAQIEAKHKSQVDAVKAEQKAAKNMQ